MSAEPMRVDATRKGGTVEIPALAAGFTYAVYLDDKPLAFVTISEPLLPFCDCGSVDKYGDDLGEHGPRCPYHLAVLRISPTLSSRELDDLCMRTLRAMAATA